MSWDVWIVRVPEGLQSLEELPAGHQFPVMPRVAVFDAARRHLGTIEPRGWSEAGQTFAVVDDAAASFLALEGPEVYGEIGLSQDSDGERGLMLNVRGGSDRLVTSILAFAEALSARAFDLQRGDWLRPQDGAMSFAQWSGYRSRVVSDSDEE